MDYLHFISWVANGLLAIMFYLLRQTIEDGKARMTKLEQDLKDQAKEIVEVKVHYLQKDDFSEFKEELWRKLDDIKTIVGHQS